MANGIKKYRNLVHPGKVIRLRFHVGAEEAAISKKLLDHVIRDLSDKRSTA